ncbi:hypothetical protein HMPREF9418_0055 [Neisseria macacae ATCC 33926]|uniref:Uncharacterized protein n=2 Tax=Neisseria TaxID=482 RepID=I2NST7_NEISI|nr:hypothetical protein HMPREF9418_0055 [Neisseria macacae ATCC 33926]EIG28898.1 hypothetical protein HMPREF1051_2159 [Neisseria sicca VK64]
MQSRSSRDFNLIDTGNFTSDGPNGLNSQDLHGKLIQLKNFMIYSLL